MKYEGLDHLCQTLIDSHLTVAVAESCTGGLLASQLTKTPGSSSFFTRGYVCYANLAKTDDLNIDPVVLDTHGAVSEEVAKLMAKGLRERSKSDIGIAITGTAGPDGGTDDKPVGTVFIAHYDQRSHINCQRYHFDGDRDEIRWQAVEAALNFLADAIAVK